MAIDFLKMLDPRRGQLGKIDLLDPAVTGTVGFLIGGPVGAAIGAGVGASVKGMEAQQAYRLKYPVVVDPTNLSNFAYPEDIITTRLKIRGHGRSMRIKYESEQGKDFILLGWGMIQGRNTRF